MAVATYIPFRPLDLLEAAHSSKYHDGRSLRVNPGPVDKL